MDRKKTRGRKVVAQWRVTFRGKPKARTVLAGTARSAVRFATSLERMDDPHAKALDVRQTGDVSLPRQAYDVWMQMLREADKRLKPDLNVSMNVGRRRWK